MPSALYKGILSLVLRYRTSLIKSWSTYCVKDKMLLSLKESLAIVLEFLVRSGLQEHQILHDEW